MVKSTRAFHFLSKTTFKCNWRIFLNIVIKEIQTSWWTMRLLFQSTDSCATLYTSQHQEVSADGCAAGALRGDSLLQTEGDTVILRQLSQNRISIVHITSASPVNKRRRLMCRNLGLPPQIRLHHEGSLRHYLGQVWWDSWPTLASPHLQTSGDAGSGGQTVRRGRIQHPSLFPGHS